MQRNVKEGSVFEEDFLVHKLNEYKVNPKMKGNNILLISLKETY